MVIPDFVGEKESRRCILGSISPVSTFGIKTRSRTMRTRPNMKMLACLGTYFALLAYEVAFDKHCVAFQLARASSSAGLFKSTSAEIDREQEMERENNGIGKRIYVEGETEDETGCHVRFPIFPRSLASTFAAPLMLSSVKRILSARDGEMENQAGRG